MSPFLYKLRSRCLIEMEESRQHKVEILSGNGNLEELKILFKSGCSQLEIDTALENAVAYSQIEMATYLLSIGADFSNYNYQGAYYAVYNNECEGVKFAISNGVDINVNNGMLLNTSVETSINTKSTYLTGWLLENGANPKLLSIRSLHLVEQFGSEELKYLLNTFT